MNDFDYDSMQKKRIARGAMNKVRHTGCTLPHEHLTKKELKKMNGEVKTYKLDAPMTWMEFRKLPEDLKKKYIANLRDLYHANCTMLARMFDVKINTLSEYFKAHSIARFSSKEGTKYGKDKNIQAAWEAFCNGVVGGGDSLSQVTPQEVIRNIEETGPKMIEMDFPVNMEKIRAEQDKINRELMEEKGWIKQEHEANLVEETQTEEPHALPVDKLDIIYHDVKSLSELKSLICGDITFKNPMEIKIYIREEPKKLYQNLI